MPASLISSRLPNLPRRRRSASRTRGHSDDQRQQRRHRHVEPEQPDEVALVEAARCRLVSESTKASTSAGAGRPPTSGDASSAQRAATSVIGGSARLAQLEAQRALDAQRPVGLAAEADLHRARQLRGVEPVAELDVVARVGLELRGSAIFQRALRDTRPAPRPACRKVWCRPPRLTRQVDGQRLVGQAPGARDARPRARRASTSGRGTAWPRRRSTAARRAAARLRPPRGSSTRAAKSSIRPPSLRVELAASAARRPAPAPARCASAAASSSSQRASQRAMRGGPHRAGRRPARSRCGATAWLVRSCGSGRRRSRRATQRPCAAAPRRHCRAAAAGGPARPGPAGAAPAPGVAKKRRSAACPRPGTPSRWRTAAGRRAPAAATARRAAAPAARASAAMSSGRRSQRTSGWRRTMPEALHGASSRMASNGRPSHQARGVARRRRPAAAACRLQAVQRVAARAARRCGSLSSASRSRSASSSRCAVLPPGAAQASSTRAPARQAGAAAAAARRAAPRRPAPRPRLRRSRAAAAPGRAAPAPRACAGRVAARGRRPCAASRCT